MEDIEKLKQDNEKLTERLNNAAKFFREQKTQIENLTKENEELKKNQNVVDPKTITELNDQIKSKDQAYKVLQDTYNEVFGELNELKETNKRNVNAFEDLNTKFKQLNELYDACEAEKLGAQADYENLKEQFEHIKIQEEANREAAAQAEELYEECEKYRNFMRALSQLTKTVNIEWLSPNEMNEDQKKVLNEVTTPKKEQAANKDTKKVVNDKGKNFREQDFPLMSM